VIKLVTGIGEPLAGRLLAFDLRDVRFRMVRLHRRPECPTCGHATAPGTA
jgi:adenylyltransferase/sulfurtransferase